MHRANVGHYAHVRLGNPAQQLDFPQGVHAHFQHYPLVGGVQIQQSQRQTDFIIQVALVFQGVEAGGEDIPDQFFGGAFAHTAGNADDARIKPLPPVSSQLLQPLHAVGHLNTDVTLPQGGLHLRRGRLADHDGTFRRKSGYRLLGEGRRGPLLKGLPHVIMPIDVFAGQGHKQASARRLAGIDDDAAEWGSGGDGISGQPGDNIG